MPQLMITESDSRRIRMLLENANFWNEQDRKNKDALAREIDNARIVPSAEIPADVITMHSRARIIDLRTGEQRVFQIVYPHEADYAASKISVLAPIGTALLGCSTGTEITWVVPSGTRNLLIEAVEHQPEAALRSQVA